LAKRGNSNNDNVYRTLAHTNEAFKITGVKIEGMLMSGHEKGTVVIIEGI
jgi:hypothetical protein